MPDSPPAQTATGLVALVGLAVVVATLLTAGLETAAIAFDLVMGALLGVLALWGAITWETGPARRRVVAPTLLALLSLALLAEWYSADYPVTLRRIMIALGLLGLVLGAFAAWRGRVGPA